MNQIMLPKSFIYLLSPYKKMPYKAQKIGFETDLRTLGSI
jgi:hypothetical protein